jgi:hypothetical protein
VSEVFGHRFALPAGIAHVGGQGPRDQTDAAPRIKAETLHVNSSHSVMLSKPEQIAEVILKAYRAVGKLPQDER